MNNQFTHAVTWPQKKARIIANIAELKTMIDDLIAAFPEGCEHVLETRAMFSRVDAITKGASNA